ncbi:MAG: hypothetical protein A3B74_00190 [Candidatus Kerfeldbacteria bacterium RIFCSPHIGHO2_02_FULL_42_14]|uniref:ABC transporter n=1 Tax=Candidatus Kerfeldbacteria bacterium RIFCSPHIGHO2_02_FULL_42_14 TaxID=1798540 RepID=A0A1G2AQU4_9BACT|nr:MAG: hypothetical protein A3B74_00190 [Candidatus Kerfeldbacteria bacterium RIFCSPHIGHO2_02_FULL_42_14]OGY81304.1 MAG: hypothetical protein A3E60_02550 [Candidatus Kerfeldbacteria bacterium RIFCSPHIGHO2_12_FULL_42_13]OGY83578.1 MAG: hypothetical protein A3I91_02980 [Candidatus Kerfeldbacteria bacterium RIFCSPLOWO2_02_FULL_42_19]OGY86708.1 MAG: hypothetical protein A3G01_00645 [Candidatus Kerfeldbacteria bacterium RIFCSPLOWO2_12_FULL_43_9]
MRSRLELTKVAKEISVFSKNLWELLKPVQKAFVTLIMLMLFIQLARLLDPWLLSKILDFIKNHVEHIQIDRQLQWDLALLILAYTGLYAGLDLIDHVADRQIWKKTIADSTRHQYIVTHQKLFDLSLGFHEQHNSGELMKQIHRGIDNLIMFLLNLCYEFFPTSFLLLVSSVMLLIYDWWVMAVFGVLIIPYIYLSLRLEIVVKPMHEKEMDHEEALASDMVENALNINSIQSHGMQERVQQRVETKVNHIIRLWYDINTTYIRYNVVRGLCMAVSIGIVLGVICLHVVTGRITLGEWYLCMTLSIKNFIHLYRIFRVRRQMAEAETGIKRLITLLKTPPLIEDLPHPRPLSSVPNPTSFIRFEDVDFEYNSRKRLVVCSTHNGLNHAQEAISAMTDAPQQLTPAVSSDMIHSNGTSALHDVNVNIQFGEFIGIAGLTGSGKSTFVKLLLRHYDPKHGTIFVNGQPLKTVRRSDWRQNIGYVPQEVEVFSRTIAQNIACFSAIDPENIHEQAMHEIIAAAKIAQAHEFIMKLPNGYNTLIGERGMLLSGGQRQLIGIARAIARQPKLLIFDEATSSVDSEHEALIQQAIEKIRGQGRCTMLAIAHRLPTIQNFDRILVFHEGRLVEIGSHRQLLNTTGIYARLWSKQMRQ